MTDLRLIIHIGDFKTGSSALQTWLAQGGGAEAGIFAPPIDAHDLAHRLKNPDAARQAFAALGQALRGRAGLCLLSSEHFEAADPAALAYWLDTALPPRAAAPEILAYARPHAPALIARYAESIKIGSYSGPMAAYLDWKPTFWRLRQAPRFARWRAVFGTRFHLRLYDRAGLAGGDIRRDVRQFLCGDAGAPLPPLEINQTPKARDLAFLGLVQAALTRTAPPPDHLQAQTYARMRRLFGRHLCARLQQAGGLGGAELGLDADLAGRLWSGYRADARAMDAHFAGAPFSLSLTEALLDAHQAPRVILPNSLRVAVQDLAAQVAPALGDEARALDLLAQMAQDGVQAGALRLWGRHDLAA